MAGFPTLKTLTLTLDRVILHTDVHHLSISTYTPHFIKISLKSKKRFMDGRTYVRRADGRTFETGFIRSNPSKSQPKKTASTHKSAKHTLALLFVPCGLDLCPFDPQNKRVSIPLQGLICTGPVVNAVPILFRRGNETSY